VPNFKDPSVFRQLKDDGNFDVLHAPGQPTPFSGIYRCVSCGFEAVSTRHHPLPPEITCAAHGGTWPNDHGWVQWKLVAAAIHIKLNA